MKNYEVGADKVYKIYQIISKNNRIDKVSDLYIRKIVEKTGFSRGTVYNALNFLEDIEVVELKRNGKKKNPVLC